MNTQKTAALIAVYGAFLVILGTLYLIFIDISFNIDSVICLTIGILSGGVSFFMLRRMGWAFWAGLLATFAMIFVMGWRTLVALFHFVDMIQNDKLSSPYDEGEAFLIILTVFFLSIFTSAIQVMLARSNARELNN